MRPAIHPPRDLALAGRILRSVLSCVDRFNPVMAVSQPAELGEAVDRVGQVAALCAARDALADKTNARRLQEWAARYRAHAFDVPSELPQWAPTCPAPPAGDHFALPDVPGVPFRIPFPAVQFSLRARKR